MIRGTLFVQAYIHCRLQEEPHVRGHQKKEGRERWVRTQMFEGRAA